MTDQIAELLRNGYQTIGRGDVRPIDGPLAREIRNVMRIYVETSWVEVIDILVNGPFGVVLTHEATATSGQSMRWRGVHLWTFQGDRCVQFEAYRQALIVMIPGPGDR